MAKAQSDVLVIGVGGHAVALDSSTGTELWRTKLKVAFAVTVQVSGARVFAGAGGELFCLDAASGNLLWRNKLKGLGTGIVAFTSSSESVAQAAVQAQRAAAAAAAS
jgi:outer membrane protein assembly factor BamB